MRHIYLDYNATTPVAPSVQEAMAPFLTQHFGNPSSSHAHLQRFFASLPSLPFDDAAVCRSAVEEAER